MAYLILSAGLVAGFVVLRGVLWQSTAELHTLLEVIATLTALVVGLLGLARFYSKKTDFMLFIAVGFLGAGLLDGYHAIVTSTFFQAYFPSPPPSLIPWSWLASRVFLAALIGMGWLLCRREGSFGEAGHFREGPIYVLAGAWLLASFLLFALVPLPPAMHPERWMPRPQELLPAGVFAVTLWSVLRSGLWKREVVAHWLVLTLILNVAAQGLFMTASARLFDPMFDAAHLLKLGSYLSALTGLLIGTFQLYRQAEVNAEQLESMVATKTAQFRQAQKMEAIGQLAGGVAHDFNNMLTVIIGHTDMIISSFGRDAPLQSDLAEIKSAGERAAALTQQLLAFSRRQFLQPHVLDLNAVVADITKMLRRLVSEHIELVTTLDPKLAWVKADRGQIEQVIMNLVVNARDVLPQGGRISITTGNVELDDGYVRDHAGARPGPHVMLAVGDTGPGMDAETQTHIFEPFFTTKEPGKGTGLGLATVYGIVKQSDGYIEVDSAPGKGAAFRIYLPRTKEALEPAAPSIVSDSPRTGTETVLLVEDEDQVRKFIFLLLRKHGYTVFEAGHGEEALRICGEHQGQIHLLFSDMVMPGLNGRELAIRVKAGRPETRVLFMSAYTRDAVEQLARMAPGTPFLKKPFSIDSLLSKVREVLES